MFAFFSEVTGFFEAAWNFFINFVESLITAITVMVTSTTFLTNMISYVPSILGASITVFLVVYSIKLLTGR